MDEVSLEVRSGEILGVAGVDGNGQTELADALAGVRYAESGRVYLDGEDVTALGSDPRQERGLAYVPEDRASKGLVQDFALYENNSLKTYDEPPFSRFGWIFPKIMRRRAAESLRAYDVRPADPDARAASLSGGNQQKAVLAQVHGDRSRPPPRRHHRQPEPAKPGGPRPGLSSTLPPGRARPAVHGRTRGHLLG